MHKLSKKSSIVLLLIVLSNQLNASCPRWVNATFPPVTSNQANYDDFNKYVLPNPNVTGVSVLVSWNSIESNTSPGNYDFSTWDANLMHFQTAGKMINLIVKPVDQGGSNHCTPTYVFRVDWANTVGAPTPQDVTYCPYYPGNGNLTNTYANITNPNFDNTGYPVSYEQPFKEAYKRFIAAVIQHYSNPGPTVPRIGYIRFGMSGGGEAVPLCKTYWPGYSQNTYLDYIKEMMQHIASQKPKIKMLADLNVVTGNINYPDSEAVYAVKYGNMGFGTNGLQLADISTYPNSTSDWVNMFTKYKDQLINGDSIMLSLQTFLTSDPTNVLQTGSLIDLLPFVKKYYANNLEIYTCDLLLAYDPNYNATTCNSQHPGYGSYSAAYQKAIQDFLSGCNSVAALNTIENSDCRIYPNPSANILHIEFPELPYKTSLEIFNINGAELIRQQLNNKLSQIDISAFSKGVYFIKLSNDKTIEMKRFIKE